MAKFGVTGYPLTYTLSPLMHNRAFKLLNIEAEYLSYPFPDISKFKSFALSNKLSGFNVTAPYKSDILPCIDIFDNDVDILQAANTVKIENRKLYAVNTDWKGFKFALASESIDLSNINAVILGAGGSAVSVAYALSELKAVNISILSRQYPQGLKIKNRLLNYFLEQKINCFDFSSDLTDIFQKCSLFINCTPIKSIDDDKIGVLEFLEKLQKDCFLFDLVYSDNLSDTVFTSKAKEFKIKSSDGLSMLVRQAALSLEYWLGKSFDVDEMILYLRRRIA